MFSREVLVSKAHAARPRCAVLGPKLSLACSFAYSHVIGRSFLFNHTGTRTHASGCVLYRAASKAHTNFNPIIVVPRL